MIGTLLKAITDTAPLAGKFTRYDYRPAFRDYCAVYAPLFAAAVQQEEVPQLADELLEALEQSRKKLHFWNRGAARAEQKLAVVSFLSPMLLHTADPGCSALAYALCEKWKLRWPEDGYEVADFETIADGFRHSIMGIDLANRHLRKTDRE